MSLTSLPTEIHYHLQKFLDHPSLLFLSGTNKYFEGLSSKEKVKNSLVTLEKSSVTLHTVLTKKKLLPCYICLKGLPALDHFPPLPGDKDDELGNANMGIRACATCLIATKPDCVFTYKHGVEPEDDWVFTRGHYSQPRKCKLYTSRYGTLRRQTKDWFPCRKCNFMKRYESSPFGRHLKIDEAIMDGDMCPRCYQPVWDKEDRHNRLRRNARLRRRNRVKKEQAERAKEAQRKRQQARDLAANIMMPTTTTAMPVTSTAASATSAAVPVTSAAAPVTSAAMPVTSAAVPVTSTAMRVTLAVVSRTSAAMPVTSAVVPATSAAMPVNSAAVPVTSAAMPATTQMPLSSRISMPAPLQIPVSTYMAPLQMDGTPLADREIRSGFMAELNDTISGNSDYLLNPFWSDSLSDY